MKVLTRFSIAIFCLVLYCGCNVKTIKIDPLPQLQSGSPLSTVEPLTFKIKEFEDVRSYKKQIGATKAGPKIELDEQKVSEIITQAIANELKRNGHKVLQTGKSDKADIIVEGIVRQYWVASTPGFITVTITGSVEVEMNFITGQDSKKPLSKTFRGNHYYSDKGFLGVLEYVLNQALLDMLKEFTTDEEFLNKLKTVRDSKKQTEPAP